MSLSIDVLRESFTIAATREPELTARFYDELFAIAPEYRALFRTGAREQASMLREALVAVIDHLEDASWLTTTLGALGARHAAYGVTPAMYPVVGEALLATLADACADTWTDRHEHAWRDAYAAIAALMLAGARTVVVDEEPATDRHAC